MSERPGRKALFVGIAPRDGEESDPVAGRLQGDLALLISWMESARAGTVPDAAEDAIREPVLHPLVHSLLELIAQAGRDREACREQERLFMENPVPMALRDSRLSLVKTNRAYQDLFSDATDWIASPDQPPGPLVVHGEEPADSAFLTGKPHISEVIAEQPDGTKTYFEQQVIPCRFSGETAVLAVFSYRDITLLRKLQEAALPDQTMIAGADPVSSGLYQNNPCPMLILDSQFHIREANEAFITETRLPRELLYGKRIDDLPFSPENENPSGSIIGTGGTTPLRIYLEFPDGLKGYDLYAFPLEDRKSPGQYIVQLYNVSAYLDSIRDLNRRLERITRDESGHDSGEGERNQNESTVVEPVAGNPDADVSLQLRSSEQARQPAASLPGPSLPEGGAGQEQGPAPASGTTGDSPCENGLPGEKRNVPVSIPQPDQDTGGSGQERNRGRTAEGGNGRSYGIVEFGLGGSHYALDITITREIVEMMPITSLPHAPAYLKGVMNLRGEIFNIIDIQKILGIGGTGTESAGKIIVLTPDAADGENIGIIVDAVQSVRQIHDDAIEYLNDSKDMQNAGLMKGIIKVNADGNGENKGEKHLIIWLDMQALVMDLIRRNTQKK